MQRALAGAFVVTIVSACSAKEPPKQQPIVGNPPVPTTPAAPPASARTEDPSAPVAAPRDEEGRTIHAPWNDGGSCFVYLPFPPLKDGEMRPPGSAPPAKDVACPAVMSHPAYAKCRGGTITTKAAGCECHVPGNPPRVSPSECPH